MGGGGMESGRLLASEGLGLERGGNSNKTPPNPKTPNPGEAAPTAAFVPNRDGKWETILLLLLLFPFLATTRGRGGVLNFSPPFIYLFFF